LLRRFALGTLGGGAGFRKSGGKTTTPPQFLAGRLVLGWIFGASDTTAKARRRFGLRDSFVDEILRCAQNDGWELGIVLVAALRAWYFGWRRWVSEKRRQSRRTPKWAGRSKRSGRSAIKGNVGSAPPGLGRDLRVRQTFFL
jgi:hypothetical protein